jgi:hypothetical protein
VTALRFRTRRAPAVEPVAEIEPLEAVDAEPEAEAA